MGISKTVKEEIDRILDLSIELGELFRDKNIHPAEAHHAMLRIIAAMIIRNEVLGVPAETGFTVNDMVLRKMVEDFKCCQEGGSHAQH